MAYQLLMRTSLSEFCADSVGGVKMISCHALVAGLLEAEGSPEAAPVLAEPVVKDSFNVTEWLTRLEGVPAELGSLRGPARDAATDALAMRARELAALGARLAGSGSEQRRLAGSLVSRLSVEAAGAASGIGAAQRVFVVGGRPVLAGWGLSSAAGRGGGPGRPGELTDRDRRAIERILSGERPRDVGPGPPPAGIPAQGTDQPAGFPAFGPGQPGGFPAQGPVLTGGFPPHGSVPSTGQYTSAGPLPPPGQYPSSGGGQHPLGPRLVFPGPHASPYGAGPPPPAPCLQVPGAGPPPPGPCLQVPGAGPPLPGPCPPQLTRAWPRGQYLTASGAWPPPPGQHAPHGSQAWAPSAARADTGKGGARKAFPAALGAFLLMLLLMFLAWGDARRAVMSPPPAFPDSWEEDGLRDELRGLRALYLAGLAACPADVPDGEPLKLPEIERGDGPPPPAPAPTALELVPEGPALAVGCWRSEHGLAGTAAGKDIVYSFCIFEGGSADVRVEVMGPSGKREFWCPASATGQSSLGKLTVSDTGAKCPADEPDFAPTRVVCAPEGAKAARCSVRSQEGELLDQRFVYMGEKR